jgi:DNA-binding IclR family transcriptional regulator
VPVFDAAGAPTMTIGAAAFSEQLDTRRTQSLAADLGELARRATRAIAGPSASRVPAS